MAIQPPQRFELDDLAHVEREARTIYAPGATPGDVLVVQSDHSLIAAPGGGSQPVQALYSGNSVDIADGFHHGLTFDSLSGGADLLDRTDPANPTALASGLYLLVAGFNFSNIGAALPAATISFGSGAYSFDVSSLVGGQVVGIAPLSAGDALQVSAGISPATPTALAGLAATVLTRFP